MGTHYPVRVREGERHSTRTVTLACREPAEHERRGVVLSDEPIEFAAAAGEVND